MDDADHKLVIFDLDDTLIDFATTRGIASTSLSDVLLREGFDAAAYMEHFAKLDKRLFSAFELGQLTRAEYRQLRFSHPFSAMGLVPPLEIVQRLNKIFMDCVNDSPILYPDVMPTLERLQKQGLRMAILTNGPSDGQRRKLKATGLGDVVHHVAIGEEVGFSKPSPQAFHSVVDRFAFDKGHALMVGDSPILDYDAALSAGLRALLLDRNALHAESGRTSIRSLLDEWGARPVKAEP